MLKLTDVVCFSVNGQTINTSIVHYRIDNFYYLVVEGSRSDNYVLERAFRTRNYFCEGLEHVRPDCPMLVAARTLADLQTLIDRIKVELSVMKPLPAIKRALDKDQFGCQTSYVYELCGVLSRSSSC